MIGRVIEFSVRNRFLVVLGTSALVLWGVYCLFRTPVDAIPDLSENQVIVWADWPGRSPQEIEDQVTYPLSVNLQGLAGVKAVRSTSEFGFSMVNIIFEEGVDYYFARERVLERLSIAASFLPPAVVPYLAPDATALGQIFWYTVEGDDKSLDELRAIQDWYVRYQLSAVPGVAQVASAGGHVREYQIDVDPEKLRAFDLSLGEVFRAVMGSNLSSGGKVIHKEGAEYLVRGVGWIRGLDDVRAVVVAERQGVPITVEQLGSVQLGPAFRRSFLEKEGREVTGGVVMMRHGENPLALTERIKAKIEGLRAGLPAGVRIVPFYDRTGLILASLETLERTLLEEIVVAAIVVFLVLWHLRSAVVICVTLPLAVLISFIFMYYLEIPSNIMSLSGIAISIGVLVDAGVVMTENAYNRLHQRFGSEPVRGDTRDIVIEAARTVGGPLFFSIVIMLLSFAPVFFLGGLEGKMFNPLAWTKSFALAGVAILAVTLVPAMLPFFVRGRLRSQEEVWLVRSLVNVYKPMLAFFIRRPGAIVVITGAILLAGLPIFPRKVPWIFFTVAAPFLVALTVVVAARRKLLAFVLLFLAAAGAFLAFTPLGEEFMPPLDELSLMDMPITSPAVNLTQAGQDIQARNQVLRAFPEVSQVVGKLGRADTATDPAPIDMVETIINLHPVDLWPKRRVEFEAVLAEAREVWSALAASGLFTDAAAGVEEEVAGVSAMAAAARCDRLFRELSRQRLAESVPARTRALLDSLRARVLHHLRERGALREELAEGRWTAFTEAQAGRYATRFEEGIALGDVKDAANEVMAFLEEAGAVSPAPGLLLESPSRAAALLEPIAALTGKARRGFLEKLEEALARERHELFARGVMWLDAELEARAPGSLVWILIEEAIREARGRGLLAREPAAEELQAVRAAREEPCAQGLSLLPKQKSELQKEMDSELQVPGWANIWTQPIVNRIDMLATGVRTMVGVKVFGDDLDTIQRVSEEVGAVIQGVRGAVDVIPDQTAGENYLEVRIDRQRAARYGVKVEDVQDVVDVALGGKEITTTVEGRERFPVRVRYARDWRADEERVKSILVPAAGEAPATLAASAPPSSDPTTTGERLRQVPLSEVAEVRVVSGPSMLKSENGLLRSYVQLNVRDRDLVGFVEEARREVEAKVALPPGVYLEWSGQFEHQVRAQQTLTLLLPLVVIIIFAILYFAYRDVSDACMMFLAVPGAVAGGALLQQLFGYNFSVAVWIGYIACFGLATETGIVMLVYLREAIARRGGMEAISSEAEIESAVMEGAVHRLRPKLLTEGTTILALIPMLWASGVGAEFMRPMAVPILGGILVADEVIDLLIPVLFYHDRCRRLRRRREGRQVALRE